MKRKTEKTLTSLVALSVVAAVVMLNMVHGLRRRVGSASDGSD